MRPSSRPPGEDSLASGKIDLQPRRLLEASRRANDFGPRPGERFGPFLIQEEIGRGGMGVVYLAEQEQPRRQVALKVLGVRLAQDLQGLERFQREIRAVGSFKHENIVRVHTAGVVDDCHYFAMEYVEGHPLSEELAKGPVEPRRAARLALQAARGIAYAHQRGVLHRDVKPSNLLVVPREGGGDQVLLVDFGLSRGREDLSLTGDDQVLGTPRYMAPEQVLGRPEDVDARCDIYSLGATLYEMLTGRPRYFVRSVEDRQRVDAAPPPRRIRGGIPRDLENICLMMAAEDPADRYPTAQAAVDDLERFQAGRPVQATPGGIPYRAVRFLGRHRATSAVAALAILSLAVSAVWFTVQLDARREEADHARAAAEERAREAERLLAELEARRRLEETFARALRLLETARPALESARRFLYDREARYEDLVRLLRAAQDPIEQAIAIRPDLPLGHYLLGQARVLRGDDHRAESSWREAIRLDPAFAQARFQLGRLLIVRSFLEGVVGGGDGEGSPRAEALRLATEAMRALELPLAAGASGFEADLQRRLALALCAYHERNFARVRELAIETLQRFPGGDGIEDFHWLLGLVSRGEDRLESYGRALEKVPRFPLALLCRGSEYAARGEHRKATADYDLLLELQPGMAWARISRGIARKKLNDPRGAIEDYDVALSIEPSASVFYHRANARKMLGDTAGAIGDYDAALELDPRHAESLVNRGNARRVLGDLAGAIADYARALDVAEPGWSYRADVSARLAEMREQQGR